MLTIFAALLGFLGVVCGAFGAHGLEARLNAEQAGWWATASHYLLVHAACVLAVSLSRRGGPMVAAGYTMGFGAALFAATLYALALGAPRWFGAITPMGGLGMIAGWAMIGIAGWRRQPE